MRLPASTFCAGHLLAEIKLVSQAASNSFL